MIAGSWSLFATMSHWRHPISRRKATTRFATKVPVDFEGTAVDNVILDFTSRTTSTGIVSPTLFPSLPLDSSPMKQKSKCTSGKVRSPVLFRCGISTPRPRAQCLHQFLKGRWVRECSATSCSVGSTGSSTSIVFRSPCCSSISPLFSPSWSPSSPSVPNTCLSLGLTACASAQGRGRITRAG